MDAVRKRAMEAAERRRSYLESEIRVSPLLVLADCQDIADGYLVEHDPTPLTVEKLVEMGFGVTDSPRRAVRGPLSCNLACLDWTIVHPGATRSRDVYPPPRTAGHLNMLLSMLEER